MLYMLLVIPQALLDIHPFGGSGSLGGAEWRLSRNSAELPK